MSPFSQADGHNFPRLVGEPVPGFAAQGDDLVVIFEDAVREPVVAHVLPDILDWIELGRFRRQRQEGDVVGQVEFRRGVPAGLIHDQHGMGAGSDRLADLGEVEVHRKGVAPGQDEPGAGAARRADCAEDVGPFRALIMRCDGPRAAPGPAPCDLVLLADARLVLKPDFQRYARADLFPDTVQRFGETFLKCS
jgi:hypothetical protein